MDLGVLIRDGDRLKVLVGGGQLLNLHVESTEGWSIIERTWFFREMENLEVGGEIIDDCFKPHKPNMDWVYWKERCLAAEKYIGQTPCDPDIYPEQMEAYSEWQKLIKDER